MIDDTIVAPATIPGTGAISILRISGPDCFRIVDAVVQLKSGTVSESNGYTIHFGAVFGQEGALLDDVLVSVFRAPHSYTGEDSVEISCHASSYIVSELIRLLLMAGCRMAGPGEFTQRAFLNGKMDLAQAEAVADVIAATNAASHRVALSQLKGVYSAELEGLRQELVEMASLLELELDFSEEDVEFAGRERLMSLIDATLAHIQLLSDSFRKGNAIKNGVPVAIVGPANAGKSTLLNALLGEDRALVSSIAGTTRDTVEETLNLGGLLFRFIDTAGIRATDETVEKMGIARTFRKITEADIILALLDASSSDSDLLNNLKTICEHVDPDVQSLVILLNKTDLVSDDVVNKNVNDINKFVSRIDNKISIVKLAAKSGMGLDELKSLLVRLKKDLIAPGDSTFVTNIRHFEALQSAASSLSDVRAALSRNLPAELLAEDLRAALRSINSILGRDLLHDPDTILHHIFAKHCIGK